MNYLELILQIETVAEAVTQSTDWGRELEVKGLMGVLIIAAGVWIFLIHRKLSKVQESRLAEAKENADKMEVALKEYMAQTQKMILVVEMFNQKTNRYDS